MSDEKKQLQVTKFTLNTKKVVYFREPEIGDSEHAMRIAGKDAGPENQGLLSVLFQKEMTKLLLVKVDDKTLSLTEKQNLKALFTFREWSQVQKAVQAVVGDEGNLELTPEITTL